MHGTPADDNQYLLEDVIAGRLALASPADIDAPARRTDCRRIVLCAHSHQPRLAHAPGGLLIVNPGSVGCPAYADPTSPAHVSETGSPHARYALLTRHAGRWAVDQIAIDYDWEAAAARARSKRPPRLGRCPGYRVRGLETRQPGVATEAILL